MFSTESSRNKFCSIALASLVFITLFITHAWVAEDAYISFRTMDNFVHGYGLRWNIAERVQSFTHPLWFFVLTPFYAICRDPYFIALVISFACSFAAVFILMRDALDRSYWFLVWCVACFFSSKAFMDYTSSGLENPLSFLLILLVIKNYYSFDKPLPKKFLYICFLSALLATNRQDLILICLPLIVSVALKLYRERNWRAIVVGLALGFSPLLLWELFSLVYYGVPFPNTYYAKLYTGISKVSSIRQGFIYVLESLGRDPASLFSIAVIAIMAVVKRSGVSLVIGIVLYLCYVINVGGDFMTGRFISVPFFASMCALIYAINTRVDKPFMMSFAGLMLLFAIGNPVSPIKSTRYFSNTEIPPNGVADERGWYFQQMGLLNYSRTFRFPNHFWRDIGEKWRLEGVQLQVWGNVGIAGYYAGPGPYIVDFHALTDPFLARLPIVDTQHWRIGHFMRNVPKEYMDSLATGENKFTDPDMAKRFDDIQKVTRGDLFSSDRWAAMFRINSLRP